MQDQDHGGESGRKKAPQNESIRLIWTSDLSILFKSLNFDIVFTVIAEGKMLIDRAGGSSFMLALT